jgi:hypothetical protein
MNRGQIVRIRADAALLLLGSGWNFSCLLVRQELAQHFKLSFRRVRIGKFLFEKSKVFNLGPGGSKYGQRPPSPDMYLCRYVQSTPVQVLAPLECTPAMALGITDRAWMIAEALATQPIKPVPSAPDRRKLLREIQGGRAG